jgi:hypothetical protein
MEASEGDGRRVLSSAWRGVCCVAAVTVLTTACSTTYLGVGSWLWRTHGPAGQPIRRVIDRVCVLLLLVGPGIVAVITVGTHLRPAGYRALWGLVSSPFGALAWSLAQYNWRLPPGWTGRPKVLWDLAMLQVCHTVWFTAGVMLVSWIAAIIWRRRQRARLLAEAASLP